MTLYLYLSSPTFIAANHILNFTALDRITDRTQMWWAGAECVRVELASPRMSTGESILWAVLTALAEERVEVDVSVAQEWLDADNYDALVTALGLVKAAA